MTFSPLFFSHARLWLLVTALLLSACNSAQVAENAVQQAQGVLRSASQAYAEQDYARFTTLMEEAHALNPASIYTQYNLACGYALTGRESEALTLLENLTAARIDSGIASDPDLTALHDQPRFQRLLAELDGALQPISNSSEFARLALSGVAPEGITHDPDTGRFFVGSMRSGTIYTINAAGHWSRFASLARFGTYAALGMTVDSEHGLLWVAGSAFDLAAGYSADVITPPGLFAFELASGKLHRAFYADASVQGFNDVLLMSDGTIYISGTQLHRLYPGASELTPFATQPPISGANGIASDATETRLFISTYPVGLGVVDIATGQVHYVESGAEQSLYGIDGLYRDDEDLIGVQNGIQPWRLVRLSLSADGGKLAGLQLIEFANDAMTPTTAVIVGAQLYYVGVTPDPDHPTQHFPVQMRGNLGETVIYKAPLTAQ